MNIGTYKLTYNYCIDDEHSKNNISIGLYNKRGTHVVGIPTLWGDN